MMSFQSSTSGASLPSSSSSMKARLSNALAFQPVGEATPFGCHAAFAEITSTCSKRGTRRGSHLLLLASTHPSPAFVTITTLFATCIAFSRHAAASLPRSSSLSRSHASLESMSRVRSPHADVGHRESSQSKMISTPASMASSELHDQRSLLCPFTHESIPDDGVEGSEPDSTSVQASARLTSHFTPLRSALAPRTTWPNGCGNRATLSGFATPSLKPCSCTSPAAATSSGSLPSQCITGTDDHRSGHT
mmetsp:Transcript_52294/g.122447  ORF Transcript_52294/g.122447 Transcript_52294/m.122447 type:complete len:249 (-) Transcript_52294:103-849(-)